MRDISFESFIGKKLIEVNRLCPILTFENSHYLTIECFWRLRTKNEILLAANEYKAEETRKQSHSKFMDSLIGKEIVDIRFIKPVSDLIVEFEGELFLELFNDSSIYESWTLSNNAGFLLVSLAGGESTYSLKS